MYGSVKEQLVSQEHDVRVCGCSKKYMYRYSANVGGQEIIIHIEPFPDVHSRNSAAVHFSSLYPVSQLFSLSSHAISTKKFLWLFPLPLENNDRKNSSRQVYTSHNLVMIVVESNQLNFPGLIQLWGILTLNWFGCVIFNLFDAVCECVILLV